ncbi:cation:proton antiporter [Thiolinea disciformis]|uniref:cation:proton antiporter domain-containing protein n=1 Tax=Thiolinea disciformis TaxID=125614 RepID=UPI000360DBF5|nr:cation:proton antiporter [Thiolinea disciformis]
MESNINLLQGILLLLVMSVTAVILFRSFKLPPILGYLLVGALTSSNALGWLPENHSIDFMAEVGVVFLLFAIGLEFSFKQFLAMRNTILGLGSLQMLVSTLTGFLLLKFFNISWQGAVIAAGAMALSSTAIVVKQLTDQGELQARHGQLALGVLLFQDIAVVPFLIAIPLLSGNSGEDMNLLVMLLQGLVSILGLMLTVWLSNYLLRPLFKYIAETESVELFNITVLLVALTSAWITEALGLSLALGAFVAGMFLSETEYKHQIESEIRPFRDILMGLFFIIVGSKIDLAVIPQLWWPILLLVLSMTIVKATLIAGLTRLFTGELASSTRTGLVLAQGGEFGFALLALALSNQLLDESEVQAALAAVVISMALAPFIIRYNDKLTRKLVGAQYLKQRYKEAHTFSLEVKEIENHVIICGYRRVGQVLARLLQEQNIPYIGLELDPSIVSAAWDAGDKVYYADATRPEILIAAGLYRARMVVVTVVDPEIAKRITEAARKKQKSVPILVRIREEQAMQPLMDAGATEVLPEAIAASVMVTRRVLESLDLPNNEITEVVDRLRADGYRSLKSFFHGQEFNAPRRRTETFLHTVTIQEKDKAVGLMISDLRLEELNIRLKSLRRGDIRGDNPEPNMLIKAGDILVLERTTNQFQDIEKRLHGDAKEKDSSAEKSAKIQPSQS